MNRFRKSYPEFPQGKLEFGDDPDLIVYTREGRLGIEHTRIFRCPSSPNAPFLQEQESLQDRIVELASDIHQRHDGPDFLVYIWFNHNTRLTKKDVEGVASNLAEIVSQFNLAKGEELWIEGWSYTNQRLLKCPYAIDRIFIEHVREPALSLWGVVRGDSVPTLKPEQIQIKINEKEEKIDSYRSHCESVWLVIVADGFAPSSHFELDDIITRHIYHTRFERVFYFHSFTCAIVELTTAS